LTVKAWVENNRDISWRQPDGIGFCCIKIPNDIDDVAFAQNLLDQRRVLVVPGAKFSAPGTLRVSWLQAGSRLEEGLDHLAQQLRQRKT
jgi:aspartate/methionine/tyrosine aminotransferase